MAREDDTAEGAAKRRRLAEALRANLRRRKAQTRAREAEPETPPEDDATPPPSGRR
jgi:hypothetical protein